MCQIKPGPRCAADTAAPARVAVAKYRALHPDGPSVDPLSAAVARLPRTEPARRRPGSTKELAVMVQHQSVLNARAALNALAFLRERQAPAQPII